VAAQIAGQHPVRRREMVELAAPILIPTQQAMHEDQGRRAIAVAKDI